MTRRSNLCLANCFALNHQAVCVFKTCVNCLLGCLKILRVGIVRQLNQGSILVKACQFRLSSQCLYISHISLHGRQLTAWFNSVMMFIVAMVPIWFWRNVSFLAYGVAIILLLAVEFIGVTGMGAQRWIDLGFMRLQPSEMMKITLVMLLAAYYDWLDVKKVSRPLWVIVPLIFIMIPTALVLKQPDLGTAILLVTGGGIVMFLAGVSWWYFSAVIASGPI